MAGILDDILPLIQGQESQGNPFAVSPMGAQGPMQVMPATATNPGFGIQPAAYAGGKYNPSNPGDVAENKRIGDAYFSKLYAKYNGDVPTALMAYNWGPGHVDKWKALGSPQNLIPAETQDYVKKIMAHFQGNTGMPDNTAPTPSTQDTQDTGQGFDINSVLKNYAGQMGSLGPTLMALGAGIASGGAPGGGGWGAGLDRGFTGANEIQQTRLNNMVGLAELMNNLRHQRLEEGTVSGAQAPLSQLGSATQGWAKVEDLLRPENYKIFSQAINSGPTADAINKAQDVFVAAYRAANGKDPSPTEIKAAVPQPADFKLNNGQSVYDKIARIKTFARNTIENSTLNNPQLRQRLLEQNQELYAAPQPTQPTQTAPQSAAPQTQDASVGPLPERFKSVNGKLIDTKTGREVVRTNTGPNTHPGIQNYPSYQDQFINWLRAQGAFNPSNVNPIGR